MQVGSMKRPSWQGARLSPTPFSVDWASGLLGRWVRPLGTLRCPAGCRGALGLRLAGTVKVNVQPGSGPCALFPTSIYRLLPNSND